MSATTRRPRPPRPTPVKLPTPTPVQGTPVKGAPVKGAPASAPAAAPRRRRPAPPPAPAPTPVAAALEDMRPPTPAPRPPERKRRPAPQPTPVNGTPVTAKPAVKIDPRIKQRRIDVKRDEGRRRLKTLVISLAVIAVAGAVVGAVRSPLLDVDHVVLTGGAHTTEQDAARAAGLDRSPQLIDVDSHAVARKVARLPWVNTATARREWPATVRIDVTERTVVASLPAADGAWATADATGRVLELHPARPDAMPSVAGAAPAGKPGSTLGPRGRAAMRVAAALPLAVRSITVEVAIADTGELELRVLDNAVVRLGDTSALEAKMAAVVTVLADLQPRSWRVLDVRVPRAPVLTRR